MQTIVRINKTIKGILAVLVVTLSLGCRGQDVYPELLQQAVTSTPIVITATSTVLVSNPSPTLPVRTNTPTTFQTSTPTLSKTPIPTLLPEQREPFILDLIKTNGNCQLPCFWGTSPGVTSWDTTSQLLRYIGARFSSDSQKDGTHVFTGFDLRDSVSLRIEYVERKSLVESIYISIGHINFLDWEPYRLSTVLNSYGIPSKVLLNIPMPVEPPTISTGYNLWLLYDKLGAIIVYGGENITIQQKMQVCPYAKNRGEIERSSMFLQDQNKKLWPEFLITSMSAGRELEFVSDLSIDTFYRTFKEEVASNCITTDKSHW